MSIKKICLGSNSFKNTLLLIELPVEINGEH